MILVDEDISNALGPRDISLLIQSLGFTCHLITGNEVLYMYICIYMGVYFYIYTCHFIAREDTYIFIYKYTYIPTDRKSRIYMLSHYWK
jgi:hypothetical protein